MYEAFRQRRLDALRKPGTDADAEMRRLRNEKTLRDNIERGPDRPNSGVEAIRVHYDNDSGTTIVDAHLHLVRRIGAAEYVPPVPNVLDAIGTLTSAREWTYKGCKSLSVEFDDLHVPDEALADEDDREDLMESLLPRLFGFGLRHFELEGGFYNGMGKTALATLMLGLEHGRHTLQCLALRHVSLGLEPEAFKSLLLFLRHNAVLRHLDLTGNDLADIQRHAVRMALDTPVTCLQTLIFDRDHAEPAGGSVHPLPRAEPSEVLMVCDDFLDGRLEDLRAAALAGKPDAVREWLPRLVAYNGRELASPLRNFRGANVRLVVPDGKVPDSILEVLNKRQEQFPITHNNLVIDPCARTLVNAVKMENQATAVLAESGLHVVFGVDHNDVITDPATLAMTHVWHRCAPADPLIEERVVQARIVLYDGSDAAGSTHIRARFDVQFVAFKTPVDIPPTGPTDGRCIITFHQAPADMVARQHVVAVFAAVCREATVDLRIIE